MASIQATAQNQLIFIPEEGAQPRLLLDCSQPIANLSQLPLFPSRNDPRPPLLQLVAGYMDQCRQDEACQNHQLGFSLLLCLLADGLQHVAGPARVLEYGCGGGELSPLLAGLVGCFDRRSALYCLSESLSPQWPERMAAVAQGPQVKYLVSRYGDTGLEPGRFDVVLLNGSRPLRDQQAALAEALSLLRDSGVLLCYTDSDPLTDSLLELCFDRPSPFLVGDGRKVTALRKADLRWDLPTPGTRAAKLDTLMAQLHSGVVELADIAQAKALDRQLDRAIDEAVSLGDRRRKQQLLDLREELLSRLLNK